MTKQKLINLIEKKLEDPTVSNELGRLIDEVLKMTFDYNLDKIFGEHRHKKEFLKAIRKTLRRIFWLLGITRNDIKDFSVLYDGLKRHSLDAVDTAI